MLLLGLTGGIGAGKSTVSSILAEKGAVIVDADAIVRELQEPGTPVFEAMVEAFGAGIVAEDGTLDRQAVADIVFNDAEKLTQLNGIVHPAVGGEIVRRIEQQTATDNVVILDHPLLIETGYRGMAGVIVVDLDPEVAVERLVRFRGFSEADARSRIGRQASREDRLAKADAVLDNSGTEDDLRRAVGELWDRIERGAFPPTA